MPWLQYYKMEGDRWPQLMTAKASVEEAMLGIDNLIVRFKNKGLKLPKIDLQFTKGNRTSRFNPSKMLIKLNIDYLNWLVVIHEFAHYIHHLEQMQRRDHARKMGFSFRRERWHGARHAALVDQMAKIVIESAWHEGSLKEGAAELARTVTESPDTRLQKKLDHALMMYMKAEKKARIAETLLKRWGRRVKLYKTRLAKLSSEEIRYLSDD